MSTASLSPSSKLLNVAIISTMPKRMSVLLYVRDIVLEGCGCFSLKIGGIYQAFRFLAYQPCRGLLSYQCCPASPGTKCIEVAQSLGLVLPYFDSGREADYLLSYKAVNSAYSLTYCHTLKGALSWLAACSADLGVGESKTYWSESLSIYSILSF